jgi:hypothetical protein
VKSAHSVKLQALFHYPVPATPGAAPVRVMLKSTHPMDVSLTAHDIKPRDGSGILLASELDLMGKLVAHQARVSVELVAVPAAD